MLIAEMAPRLLRSLTLVVALFALPGLATAQQPVPTPVPGTVIVEWTTESEVNLAGFNIYRSDSRDGPFVRLNDTLIPASPDPVTGGSYTYTDSTAEPGVIYYYQLEDVELDGKSTMHGPIVAEGEANAVSSLVGTIALLALVGMVLAGVAALVVMARRRPLAGPRSTESGGAEGPEGEIP